MEEKSAGRETGAMIRVKILVEGQTEIGFTAWKRWLIDFPVHKDELQAIWQAEPVGHGFLIKIGLYFSTGYA
ncbi:MAG: hypothetical protein GY862_17805 [Gammaproteobacteria bacterium]|nr:hypothetical protein [Gammaproteobacteria bacterium]